MKNIIRSEAIGDGKIRRYVYLFIYFYFSLRIVVNRIAGKIKILILFLIERKTMMISKFDERQRCTEIDNFDTSKMLCWISREKKTTYFINLQTRFRVTEFININYPC